MTTKRQAQATPVVKTLNQAISCATVLAQKLRHYHWNVVGGNFFDMHEQFGFLYELLADNIDTFAERVRQLGFTPVHTLAGMLQVTEIKEDPRPAVKDMEMCSIIIGDFATLAHCLAQVVEAAKEANDRHTCHMIDKVTGKYDKRMWFLKSFCQGGTSE